MRRGPPFRSHRHFRSSLLASWVRLPGALASKRLLRERAGGARAAPREGGGKAGLGGCFHREKCVNSATGCSQARQEGIAMAVAELTLFGGFELQRPGGEVINLPGQKDRALLAVLA